SPRNSPPLPPQGEPPRSLTPQPLKISWPSLGSFERARRDLPIGPNGIAKFSPTSRKSSGEAIFTNFCIHLLPPTMSSQSSTTASTSRKPTTDATAKVTKSLRQKVLKNTAARSVQSEKAARPSEPPQASKAASEPDATDTEVSTHRPTITIPETPVTKTESEDRSRISETIIDWEQCGISPPRQIISDEESSLASSAGQIDRPERKSMLYRTPRRGTGVEMDLATREANNLLQKGKEALEAAGNMKRECKTATYECLQGLYETVLSLADSRARHKYNLERERSRHAQELVRVERAHNRDVMALKAELSLMRTDLSDTKREAKGIREWLGHETLDAFKGIKEVKEEVKATKLLITKEHEKTRRSTVGTPGDPKRDSMGEDLSRMETNINSVSNQLDVLRKALENLRTDLTRPYLSPSNQPLTERLELVSADIRVLRDKEPSVQIPAVPSLDAELAAVEVKRTLQNIEKGVADLSKADRPPKQQQGPRTFAQVASTPKHTKPPQPNHTLIVSSTDPKLTGDNVIERIRLALDLKTSGARVDTVRKARNQKVVLRCASKTDLNLVKDQFKSNSGLKVQEPKPQNPMVCIKGVLSSYSDGEIVDLLKLATEELLMAAQAKGVSVALVQEPYVGRTGLDPKTQEAHNITGPQIYTDGSKIEGKVGAAVTWWENGEESKYSTFGLEPHNTVFQSEMYALFRAVKMARESRVASVSILSDSRSSLDLLRSPKVASVAVRANKTQNGLPSVPTTQRTRQNTAVTSHTTTTLQPTHPHAEQQPTFLAGAARGTPGLRLRGVALFMNRETEKLGISFCVGSSRAGARVHISPGLAALINGSTTKASMKGSKYAALPQVVIDTHRCRLVRFKGKTVALLEWSEETPFAQANRLLQKIGEAEELAPRTISVDAMAVGWEEETSRIATAA
ncbi:hypothetical protein HW555_006147, partial [Spodoptera exigua]